MDSLHHPDTRPEGPQPAPQARQDIASAMPGLATGLLSAETLARQAAALGISCAALLLAMAHALLLRTSAAGSAVALQIRARGTLDRGLTSGFISSQSALSAPLIDDRTSFVDLAEATTAELAAVPLRRDLLASALFAERHRGGTAPPPGPGVRLEFSVPSGPQIFALDETADGLLLHAPGGGSGKGPIAGLRLLETMPKLLEAVLERPRDPVSRLPLLAGVEWSHRIRQWNATAWPLPKATLDAMVARQTAERPDAIAVRDQDHSCSYAQLDDEAERLRLVLHSQGVRPGHVVAVAVSRDWRLPTAMLAVMKAGAAFLALEAGLPPDRVAFMLRDSGAQIILADQATAAALSLLDPSLESGSGSKLLLLEDLAGLAPAAEPAASAPHVCVLYSNGGNDGATGIAADTAEDSQTPRGVKLRQESVLNLLLSVREGIGVGPSDRILAASAASAGWVLLDFFLPLITGGTIVLASRRQMADGALLAALMRAHRPTLCQATPSQWRRLLAAGWQGGNLRILCGGEAVDATLADALRERGGGRFWSLYGTAEAGVWSLVECVSGHEDVVPAGRPIANTRVYVLDSAGRQVPPGVMGEVWLGGAGLADHYLRRPARTARDFRPDPFLPARPDIAPDVTDAGDPSSMPDEPPMMVRTGDRALLRPDGRVVLHGRVGQPCPVDLLAVESVLASLPGVREACCALLPGPKRPELVAFIVPDPEHRPTRAALRATARALLADRAVPDRFTLVDALPLTPRLVRDRDQLPQTMPQADPRDAEPGENGTEAMLTRFWKQVLGAGSGGAHDDFFARGAQPMQAMQLLDLVHREFGAALTLDTLTYRGSTPARLAALLAHPPQPSYAMPLNEPGAPPVFCLHTLGPASLFPYRRLADQLRGTLSLVGILPRGREDESAPPRSLHQVAQHAAEVIRAEQKAGPYRICGLLSGGLTAFATARLLREMGETVETLFLLDSRPPAPVSQMLSRIGVAGPPIADGVALDPAVLPDRLHRLYRRLRMAGRAYRAGAYDGPVLLCAASHTVQRLGDPTLGWGRYMARLQIAEIAGSHDDMVREPAAEKFAELIAERCGRVKAMA